MCDLKASTPDSLSNHVKNIHHTRESIICTICNKYYRQQKSLNKHIEVFHSEGQLKYNCNFCTFQTIHEISLKNHKINVHQGGKKYTS